MTSLLRSALLCGLLLSTASAAGEDVLGPEEQEFLKRMAVLQQLAPGCNWERPLLEVSHANQDSRARTPSWMLSRMPILVRDGTPQLVYRAPSAACTSPDFGS